MKRRDFLKISTLVTAYTFLWGCKEDTQGEATLPDSKTALDETSDVPQANNTSDNEAETILVIGAGMAGLAAARELQAQGYQVMLLEGRDRIGGRIWTDHSWPQAHLDMGASWIHGVEGNPITELADEFEIETVATDYDSHSLYHTDGHLLNEAEQAEIETRFETVWEQVEEMAGELDKDISLGQAVESILENVRLTEQAGRELAYAINTTIEHEWAADVSELSLFYWNQDEAFEGEDVLFPEGYDQIVGNLAKGLTIKLNQVVKQISYDETAVTVTTNQGDFEADRVVITLPLGVLKQAKRMFSPPLPDWKIEAIDKLGMGLLNKVYLQFETPFWPEENDLLGYISAEKGKWAEFLNIYKYTDLPILLAFNAADHGRYLETLSNEEIVAGAMQTLRQIYGPEIPDPKAWLITRWASDPFARGSYSYIPVGAGSEDYEAMAEPVAGRLFFAGEATNRDYPATVHGAFLSGVREAQRIAKL